MKKIIYSVFTLLLLGTASCKDEFFDINQNPNSPTVESITPQLILPRTLHATAARMATSYDYAAHWMGYWSRSGSYGPSAEQETYAITTGYQADEWGTSTSSNSWYDILADVDLMEKKATAADQKFYQGAAKVIKSIGFMYLVDQYNNVPYSKAFDLSGNILPAYDKGEDIYADLLVQLDAADKLFAGADVAADPGIAGADIMFKGDVTKWRKLANTQRLKLLIHMSEVIAPAAAQAEVAKITANGAGFLMSGESANVQPGYSNIVNQDNPFYSAYKVSAAGSVDQYNRANNYVLNKLMNSNDVRYQYYFSRVKTKTTSQPNDYYGYNFGEVIPNDAPNEASSSDIAGPGLAKGPDQPQWLFTSVESMFLQAEATQRGWLSGNPEAAYKAAVTESFIWLGVPSAVTVATTYLAQDNPMISYTAAPNKINLIVMQKYLGLVGINNFEAWVDYRRVGVPSDLPLSLSPNRAGNVIPSRLLYPQAEYSYNAANVTAEGTINAQNSKVFWDK